MHGHDKVIEILQAEGVDNLFTYMSEDNMSMMSEIAEGDADIRLYKSRHEQGAIAMSDGYARATDSFGVSLVGRGPAIAQAGTAMVTARKKGSNVLVMVPEPMGSAAYDIKAFDQEGYLTSTIGDVISVRSPEALVPKVREAIRRVKIGDGPLALQIAWDVLDGQLPETEAERTVEARGAATGAPDARLDPAPERIEEAVDMYVESDAFTPPVILAGRGAVRADAKEAIYDLAERMSALLVTSLQAKDYFDDHPYYLGFTGKWGSDLANTHANESKLLVAIGASLNPYTIDKGHVFGDETEVIHVDSDPGVIGEHADIDLGIQGDAKRTVNRLIEALEEIGIDREGELWTDDLRERAATFDPMNDREFPERPDAMDPRELVRTLDEVLPADRQITIDAGHFARWVADGISAPPSKFHFTADFASIGLGLPIGLGTAVGTADEQSFVIAGDGGTMMSIQELETAVRHDVDVTVIVMDDSTLSSEYHTLVARGDEPEVSRIPSPSFKDVAEAFGADAHSATSIDDVRDLADVFATPPDGPRVVECTVNHHVRHRSKI
ncbi:thiamine pyrophosphate-binding protein [Halovivax limisalsi]|uniref:thiamine pyrophosphate-binding protein n=1 Tax=Halovivax limisalsi TaxID=1453760 RepID=UPI001FFDB75D|nr:thiamine pyrophosphate-binding protein [Halovivax limisalsi]